ncbi:MAG: hypothetical protein J5994_03580 [Ruminococcus sp.]|nr:hypothetical protein [Ruminococcus sp.]
MDITKLRNGAGEVLVRTVNAMKGGTGQVHPQSLLCALGSLAGYACQQDVRNVYMKNKGMAEDTVFTVMENKQGRKFFFGDLLNEPLVNERYSVWSMIGGAVHRAGAKLPDVNDIFRYVSYVVGGEQFGRVRSCETGDDMETYVRNLWRPLAAIAENYAQDGELHIVFGLALQKSVISCKGVTDITEAARIAMESAVSMSKIELN